MVEDEKLAIDESRRIAQHEAMKGAVRNEVQAEVARDAGHLSSSERAGAAEVAQSMKHKAVSEVVDTESEIERARGTARISQFVDYIFWLIFGIIGLEIILELIGARDSNGFKRFIDALASPLLAPFRGLVDDPGAGAVRFRLSYIVALIVYLLVHLAVIGLLRIIAHRRTAV
jgi:uncharacterized protein YggT (Ycf19 family)